MGDIRDVRTIDTRERKAMMNLNSKKSTQTTKENLTSKKRRHKLSTTLEIIKECQESCKNGD